MKWTKGFQPGDLPAGTAGGSATRSKLGHRPQVIHSPCTLAMIPFGKSGSVPSIMPGGVVAFLYYNLNWRNFIQKTVGIMRIVVML